MDYNKKESDKPNNKPPLIPKGGPRGNYQLWVILGTIALVIGLMYFNNANTLKETDMLQFKSMVSGRDVQKVVLIKNLEYVEITLKAEALQNSKYKTELEGSSPMGLNAKGPHYKLTIGSIEGFEKEFQEINSRLSKEEQINYSIEKRDDYFSIFFNWGL